MFLASCPGIAALARGVLGNLTLPAFAPTAAVTRRFAAVMRPSPSVR